jgi:hypothetical protein
VLLLCFLSFRKCLLSCLLIPQSSIFLLFTLLTYFSQVFPALRSRQSVHHLHARQSGVPGLLQPAGTHVCMYIYIHAYACITHTSSSSPCHHLHSYIINTPKHPNPISNTDRGHSKQAYNGPLNSFNTFTPLQLTPTNPITHTLLQQIVGIVNKLIMGLDALERMELDQEAM